MSLDNIDYSSFGPFARACRWLEEQRRTGEEEKKKHRKEMLALDLLTASSGSPARILEIFKGVFQKPLDSSASFWSGIYTDAVKLAANQMSMAERKKYAAALPGLIIPNQHEHEELLAGLGFSVDDSKYDIGSLKTLFKEKCKLSLDLLENGGLRTTITVS